MGYDEPLEYDLKLGVDVYGFRSSDVEEVRMSIERAIGISFTRCDATYKGTVYDRYFRYYGPGGEIWLLEDKASDRSARRSGVQPSVEMRICGTRRGKKIRKLLSERVPGVFLKEERFDEASTREDQASLEPDDG